MPRRFENRRISSRNSPRSQRSILLGFQQINEKAKRRANQRRYQGRNHNWNNAHVLPEAAEAEWELPITTRLLRWLTALILLPVCIIASLGFLRVMTQGDFFSHFWKSAEFWYFTSGFILMTGWFLTRVCHNLFLYFYVWGHEFTHAIFVVLSFGRVAEFEVTSRGGYIVTNKSNIAIALSPYFFPFGSVMTLTAFTLLKLFIEIPYENKILFGLLGFTWAFHLLWTLWMIPRDQPDLKENDTFFSLILISLINIIVLSALVCLASSNITHMTFFYEWMNAFESLKRAIPLNF